MPPFGYKSMNLLTACYRNFVGPTAVRRLARIDSRGEFLRDVERLIGRNLHLRLHSSSLPIGLVIGLMDPCARCLTDQRSSPQILEEVAEILRGRKRPLRGEHKDWLADELLAAASARPAGVSGTDTSATGSTARSAARSGTLSMMPPASDTGLEY